MRLRVISQSKISNKAILMQDNFSEWPIYTPFIAYNENLLFLRENKRILMLEISDYLFRHMT